MWTPATSIFINRPRFNLRMAALCASMDSRKIKYFGSFCKSSAHSKSKGTRLVPTETVVTICFIHSRRFLICSKTMRWKLGLAAWGPGALQLWIQLKHQGDLHRACSETAEGEAVPQNNGQCSILLWLFLNHRPKLTLLCGGLPIIYFAELLWFFILVFA